MLYKLVRNCFILIGYEETDLLFIYCHIFSCLLRSAATAERAWTKLLGDVEGIMGRKKRFLKDVIVRSKIPI